MVLAVKTRPTAAKPHLRRARRRFRGLIVGERRGCERVGSPRDYCYPASFPARKNSVSNVIIVKAAFDPEAEVWFTESSDVHGLRIEAASLDALVARLPGAIRDLIEDDEDFANLDIPIEVIAHASTRVRVPERA